ncbi:MAG: hypothetical protein OXR68_03395 [Alphaproteobacteria bacterium]|nr:hypothetical protein [Alphaproteobacteria bacterium]MDD9919651.1 hypothetical protein [Alphaproteobacteria bacterium]
MTQHKFAKKLNIAVAGTGAVGRVLIERLLDEQRAENCPFKLVAISARRQRPWVKGTGISFVDSPVLLAQKPNVDVIIEALGGVQTAYDLVSSALCNGKHVITANSTMMAGYGETLLRTAQANNRYLGFEAGILAGLPLRSFFTSIQQDVPRVTVLLSNGVNRTLQRMQLMGESFENALSAVQQELPVDPSGKEDSYRLSLLRGLLYGRWQPVKQIKSMDLSLLEAADMALTQQLGGVIQVVGMANAGGVCLQPMVIQENHVLRQIATKQEGIMLELSTGAVQVTAPMRSVATAVESIMNDLKASCGKRAWKPREASSEGLGELGTGCVFVRFNKIDHDLLRRDSRWGVMQERVDGSRGKVGAILSTSLTPQQVAQILPNSIALPVWQPANAEVQPLTTPLRLVS